MARFPQERSRSPSLLAMSRRASTAPGSLPQAAHDRVQDRRSDRHLRNFPLPPCAHRPGPASHCRQEKSRASLEQGVKSTITYAEAISRGQESRLRLLGWGPPRPRAYLSALPGQPASLKILDQSPAAVTLAWRKPFDAARCDLRVELGTAAAPWLHVAAVDPTTVTIKGEPESSVNTISPRARRRRNAEQRVRVDTLSSREGTHTAHRRRDD